MDFCQTSLRLNAYGSLAQTDGTIGTMYQAIVIARTVGLFCFGVLGVAQATTYYVCAATGSPCNASDSNAGTSKTATWLHAPGMSAAISHPLAYYNSNTGAASGDQIIFRGGDTWHFGNSSASPYVGSGSTGWTLPEINQGNFSSGRTLYIGVDQTWYNSAVCGASWCRPILNGDNPTSTTAVASCAYDQSNYTFVIGANRFYVTFDNFEFTGECWSGNTSSLTYLWASANTYPTTNNTFSNLYFHGWTHTAFNCASGGTCNGGTAISNASVSATSALGDQYVGIVVDGSDSDGASGAGMYGGGYDIHNSVFRYNCNAVITNNTHLFHDNVIEYINKCADNVSHSNGVEFNTEAQLTNAVYNNIYRHFLWPAASQEVTMWEVPYSQDYVFNNLVYDTPSNANYWDMVAGSQGFGSEGNANVFNNTFQMAADGSIMSIGVNLTLNFVNNQCISPDGGTPTSCAGGNTPNGQGTVNQKTNIVQSTSAALAQGYTSSETLPYSPSSSNGSTVGAGTNEGSYCSALSTAGLSAAATACQSATGYACAYSTVTHSVSCPAASLNARPSSGAWDIGAYQSYSQSTSALQPPTNLQAAVR